VKTNGYTQRSRSLSNTTKAVSSKGSDSSKSSQGKAKLHEPEDEKQTPWINS